MKTFKREDIDARIDTIHQQLLSVKGHEINGLYSSSERGDLCSNCVWAGERGTGAEHTAATKTEIMDRLIGELIAYSQAKGLYDAAFDESVAVQTVSAGIMTRAVVDLRLIEIADGLLGKFEEGSDA